MPRRHLRRNPFSDPAPRACARCRIMAAKCCAAWRALPSTAGGPAR